VEEALERSEEKYRSIFNDNNEKIDLLLLDTVMQKKKRKRGV